MRRACDCGSADEDEDESERVRLSVSSLVSIVNATRRFFVRIRADLLKDIFACDYIFFGTSTSRLNQQYERVIKRFTISGITSRNC